MKDIVVFGASGHAKVVIDILEITGEYRIVGLIDPFRKAGESFFDYEVVGGDKEAEDLCRRCNIRHGIVAIGDNWVRQAVSRRAAACCRIDNFAKAIHPSAAIGRGVSIGPGCVITAGAVVNSSAVIAPFCIVNTNSSIEHDSRLEEFSSVAPHACLGGKVTLGKFSAILLGANVKDAIAIGEHSIIGAGSLVLDNIPDRVVCYGAPARIMRKRKEGEPYM